MLLVEKNYSLTLCYPNDTNVMYHSNKVKGDKSLDKS